MQRNQRQETWRINTVVQMKDLKHLNTKDCADYFRFWRSSFITRLLFGQVTHPRNEVSSLGALRMSSIKRLKKPISLFSDMSYTESKCLVMVC